MTPRPASTRRVLATSPFNAPVDTTPREDFTVSDRVSHDRHGLGTVTALEGETALVVDFGGCSRRLALPNPKLTKL